MVGFQLKQGKKNVLIMNGFHSEHAQRIHLTSPGIQYYRRNPLMSIVACVCVCVCERERERERERTRTNQAVGSLSNT